MFYHISPLIFTELCFKGIDVAENVCHTVADTLHILLWGGGINHALRVQGGSNNCNVFKYW